jgi:hypothetical protein
MVELGIFESYRSVDSDGMCYVRGINRIQDYNTPMYKQFFKIYISEGIIFVDKYVNKHFESTVQCANRFGFEEITVKGN